MSLEDMGLFYKVIKEIGMRLLFLFLLTLMLSICMVGCVNSSLSVGSRPAPQVIFENSQGTNGSSSPQEAFAKSVTVRPCQPSPKSPSLGEPPTASSVTWLITNDVFGLALVLATCPSAQRPWVIVLPYEKDTHGNWSTQNGLISTQYAFGDPVNPLTYIPQSSDVPTWLNIPSGNYLDQPIPLHGIKLWTDRQHIFMIGSLQQNNNVPANTIPVTIENKQGYSYITHDLRVIIIPISNGSTFFFASDIQDDRVLNWASLSWNHQASLFNH